jgi:hypothetical protein
LLTSSHTQGNKLYIVDRTGRIISESIAVGDKNINDLLSAYKASQAFFTVHPDASVTYQNLVENGYQASDGVTLTITDGLKSSLLILFSHMFYQFPPRASMPAACGTHFFIDLLMFRLIRLRDQSMSSFSRKGLSHKNICL